MTAGDPAGGVDRIEELIIELVQRAPIADAAVVDELVAALHRIGSPLARSIARVTELVAEQLVDQKGADPLPAGEAGRAPPPRLAALVDPGIALPALAMACATLADGVRGKLGERELEAARYQIDTLMPVPDRPAVRVPDVPISSLRKRDR